MKAEGDEEELVKQDSNLWEFEGPAEGDDAQSPATNGGPSETIEAKQADKDGDLPMGEAAPAPGTGSKHAPIPAPAKAPGGEAGKSGAPAQGTVQAKQQGTKFGAGINQGKAFDLRSGGRRQHRYFVLKSKSMFNVDQSVEKGIWATQVGLCTLSPATTQTLHRMATIDGHYSLCLCYHTVHAGATSDKTRHVTAMTIVIGCSPSHLSGTETGPEDSIWKGRHEDLNCASASLLDHLTLHWSAVLCQDGSLLDRLLSDWPMRGLRTLRHRLE